MTISLRLLVALLLLSSVQIHAFPPERVDVLIHGATPGGIAAAVAAGRSGRSVTLVTPYRRVGGLMTNGLSHADFRTFEGLTGSYLEFTRQVVTHYEERDGKDSEAAHGCFRGTHAEPHVNERVLEKMLAGSGVKRILRQRRLREVVREPGGRIEAVIFSNPEGKTERLEAGIFIDATYEGDLLAAAGVPFRTGREARSEYGESLAPEMSDGQIQGYNFRLVMTRVASNRVKPSKPAGYQREEFLPVLPLLESGKVQKVFCRWKGGMYKAQLPPLPGGKLDINDVSHAPVRLSLPGVNQEWPTGDAATRQRIFDEHVRHNVGLFYFLQNDPAVPEAFRAEALEWGFCRDEFVETGHLPEQLYVREARRMVGVHVFTERDTDCAPGDARAVFHADAIAMGDYGPNCHGTAHEGPRFGGRHTGEFYKRVAPYQIPYGTLLPRNCPNLLVPVAVSASHVGFCALRLEPIWMSLGQAAGHAAHLALAGSGRVQDVSARKIQERLHARGAATLYVSDVLPGSPDFEAVQWWGARGGLHGLTPRLEEPGLRGEHLDGQYYQAFPGHEADLDRELAEPTRRRWMEIAREAGVEVSKLEGSRTRGEFLRRAFRARP